MIDIVLLGATGYTGRLCASYMAQVLPEHITWTIAGRDRSKLRDLYKQLQLEEPKCTVYALDLASDEAIAELVKTARVVINTIGLYATTCGTAIIRACAENGTDYVDCGEPAWMREMIAQYDTTARESGSKIIMATGWAAAPADLSVYLAALKLKHHFSLSTREVLVCLDDVHGSFSGGSLNSLCSLEPVNIAPFDLSPVPRTDQQVTKNGVLPHPNKFDVQAVDELGVLVESTHSQIETTVIGRSLGLHAGHGTDFLSSEGYGENFFFSSRMKCSQAWP
ncbi:hypothetical protein FBEOM_9089 [Fusarium beomiforme]|uniref:Saccharopine dehydrogenase NADP binding domain-containing protein n=1 Tax=Fusarium beomiforme TaxID=44412 RepID=A0A9P5AE69_9HYPO|nr:hypothetical protein FBEOM_9089 [Fusarium beomiforme]